ncbi:UDP-N-acetylmuramate dehydrogenase [Lederbergia citrea]|uniref:UDP-N-acetylenolpyruvoylglucosamine reductase n=1 Tax=Lederbergia citrea TaxID=2833581 RepID=A0A942Z1X5_9BACI|nr:UDP-N-acetylmuramate dehydrogenase [Lederbergia citrea]MBS4203389.1 UDP-N-acetylmuramate dehydrogenase [Lederbergia citrea]MBS4221938.1 UDP-N-acetylmuramate dehydrogenase [Lederbergia citrea]
MDKLKIVSDLQNIVPDESIKISEPLSKHTFIKTGGIGDVFINPSEVNQLCEIVRYAFVNEIPLTVLGKGTNVIIRDSGIRGIVVSLEKFNEISVKGNEIRVGSGANIIEVSRVALQHQLSGLEFACGIPGTVGGALIMNAGAYGGEISNVLTSAKVITQSGEFLTLSEKEFQFGYRSSVFAKEKFIIVEALFLLEKGDPTLIKGKMDENTFLRESKQPLEYPSCGSVFKRPPNNFAGKLIQDSGLQGVRIGGAEVSTKHAGFIVNLGNATSTDYLQLIRHIQETVKEKFGVDLETEVKIIGDE